MSVLCTTFLTVSIMWVNYQVNVSTLCFQSSCSRNFSYLAFFINGIILLFYDGNDRHSFLYIGLEYIFLCSTFEHKLSLRWNILISLKFYILLCSEEVQIHHSSLIQEIQFQLMRLSSYKLCFHHCPGLASVIFFNPRRPALNKICF